MKYSYINTVCYILDCALSYLFHRLLVSVCKQHVKLSSYNSTLSDLMCSLDQYKAVYNRNKANIYIFLLGSCMDNLKKLIILPSVLIILD